MANEYFKFDWQRAFMDYEKLMPTTKHVLHALCAYMDIDGFCYPSMRTLAGDTGLSDRAVIKHIGIAKEKGWLIIGSRRYVDQRWKRNTYRAVIPKNIIKVVNEMHHVSKGGEPGAKGGEPECKKVVNEVHTNNNIIKKNKKDDEVGFSFSGEKTDSSLVSKEQIRNFKQTLSGIANKNENSITQRGDGWFHERLAELREQKEKILTEEPTNVSMTPK